MEIFLLAAFYTNWIIKYDKHGFSTTNSNI